MAIKVVIDTNIWISSIINPAGFPARIREAFEKGLFEAVVSEPLLEEIADVLSRPKIRDKYGITQSDIKELLLLIEERSEHVLVSGEINLCRDKDDDLIIETAVKGKAKYLVTRDDDIKLDQKISGFLSKFDISGLSISRFLKLL